MNDVIYLGHVVIIWRDTMLLEVSEEIWATLRKTQVCVCTYSDHSTPPLLYSPWLGRTRSSTAPQRRVLDEATRKRRQQRQLEALERDNFQDDPHAAFAHLTAKAKLPAFADGSESELPWQPCCHRYIHVCFYRKEKENSNQCRPLQAGNWDEIGCYDNSSSCQLAHTSRGSGKPFKLFWKNWWVFIPSSCVWLTVSVIISLATWGLPEAILHHSCSSALQTTSKTLLCRLWISFNNYDVIANVYDVIVYSLTSLYLPLSLYLHHVWSEVLQCQMPGHTQRH